MTDHKDVLRRISRARIKMLFAQPFFGTICMKMKVAVTDAIPTMATDGKSLFCNPEFSAKLTEPEMIGVLCHEVLHVANGHHLRKGKRNHSKWNKACDFAINPIVTEAGMTLPKDGLMDPQYRGMAAERIYDMLDDEDGPGGDGQDGGGGQWGEVLDGTKKPDGSNMSQDEISVAEQEIKVQVAEAAEAARRQGKLTSAIERMVGKLIEPKVDWKEVLRRFVSAVTPSNYTWARPNKRFIAHNIYLPGVLKEGMGQVVIGFDTSGSIYADSKLIESFVAEIVAICEEAKPEAVHVVLCDADIKSVHTFENGDMYGVFDTLKRSISGGGGTSFRPVFEWVEREGIEPAALIYLTDMEGYFPERAPDYPVLWAKTTNHRAPFGDEVRVS